MPTRTLNLYTLTSTTYLDSTAQASGLPKQRPVANYLFSATDTSAMVKGGFTWAQNAIPIAAQSGTTEKGITTTYTASPDPSGDSAGGDYQHDFSFAGMSEFWFKQRMYIPTNYFHRACLNIDVTGDISAWSVGQVIRGADGSSTGTVYWINGSTVSLLFAQNNLVGAGVWTGTITNVTLGHTRTSTRIGNETENNKLWVVWCDGYSNKGLSPSIGFELRADYSGGSVVYYHFGADYSVVGVLPDSTSAELSLITSSDLGKWIDLVYHVKMATNENAADGVIEMWVRHQGGSYTKLFSQTNALIGSRAAGLTWDKTARFAAVSNLTLSGLYTHDGKAINNGDRIFTNAQTDAKQNGIWVAAAGAWTRATDYDAANEIIGHGVTVSEASTGISAGSGFVCQNRTGTLTVGTNDISLVKFAGTVGVNVPGNATFKNGYIHGAANSGFQVQTDFSDSQITLSAYPIDGVV